MQMAYLVPPNTHTFIAQNPGQTRLSSWFGSSHKSVEGTAIAIQQLGQKALQVDLKLEIGRFDWSGSCAGGHCLGLKARPERLCWNFVYCPLALSAILEVPCDKICIGKYGSKYTTYNKCENAQEKICQWFLSAYLIICSLIGSGFTANRH